MGRYRPSGPARTARGRSAGVEPADRGWPGPSAGGQRPGGYQQKQRRSGSGERVQMGLRDLVYRLYEHRLEASLSPRTIPRHVGVILDGNRRWARSAGLSDISRGHQKGADHIFELLGWCRQAGVEVVTLWLLSTDNLSRSGDEVEALLRIIETTVRELVAQGWHVKPVGALDLLPVDTAQVLKDAAEATAHNPGRSEEHTSELQSQFHL